jgi:glutathione-regulated potassium-efflux system ancillary protein KefG
MEYLPPFVVCGTHQLHEQSQIVQYAEDYRAVITALRDGAIAWDRLAQFQFLNDDLEQLILKPEVPHHA